MKMNRPKTIHDESNYVIFACAYPTLNSITCQIHLSNVRCDLLIAAMRFTPLGKSSNKFAYT